MFATQPHRHNDKRALTHAWRSPQQKYLHTISFEYCNPSSIVILTSLKFHHASTYRRYFGNLFIYVNVWLHVQSTFTLNRVTKAVLSRRKCLMSLSYLRDVDLERCGCKKGGRVTSPMSINEFVQYVTEHIRSTPRRICIARTFDI